MKITIEIEESVYNACAEMCKPYGHSIELVVARLLTEIVAMRAVDPDALVAIYEKSFEVPGYRHLLERVEKPAPGEE